MQKHKTINLIILTVIIISLTFIFQPDISEAQAETREEEYVFRRSWGGEGDRLIEPPGVAIGPTGAIYLLAQDHVVIIQPGERIFNRFGGTGSGAGQFSSPYGIAVDGDGNVYVADTYNNRIQKFSSTGTYLTQWGVEGSGAGQFWGPYGIAVDGDGNVYVADTWNDRIQKFTSSGTYLIQWGVEGSGAGQFNGPYGIVVDGNGNVYVADSLNCRIQKFTSNGTYLTQWGECGSGAGQFGDSPWFEGLQDISVDGNGNVYVADTLNERIQKFTSNGTYLTQWGERGSGAGQFYRPHGIANDGVGNVYVADTWNERIQKFTSNGTYLSEWGESETGAGQFASPYGIAVDRNDNVYVADAGNERIQKFTSSGTYLTQWGEYGTGAGQFDWPRDIAVDGVGIVYVTDINNDRIQKFTSNGIYLTQWGEDGHGDGQFFWSRGIAVDGSGNIYVIDGGNDRIQKFTSNGTYLTQWGDVGSGIGQFESPEGVAVDGIGNVYVVDSLNCRIQKFTSNGTYITQWGDVGSGDGQFGISYYHGPYDIVVDGNGNVYVVDTENDRIQKFTSNGTYLNQWGDEGSGAGQFNDPIGIAVDENDNIYIADTLNRRIQVFSLGFPEPDPYSGLVINGVFEASPSLTEWTYGGDLPVSRSAHAAQGSYALQLGDTVAQTEQGMGDAWAHTTFYVRPEWERPVLSFKYNMFVNDIMDYSDFFVAIQDGVGLNHLATVVRDGYQPCIPNIAPAAGTDLGWRSVTYDLSKYKGQHIRLVFSNRNLWQKSWGIWTYVDDVRVVDAGPLPPLVGPYFSYLPMVNDYRCDPVPGVGRDVGGELMLRPDTP